MALEGVEVGVLAAVDGRGAHVGVVVRVGEVKDLLALVRDGHAGDHAVGLAGLDGGKGGVEAQGLQVVVETLVLGDGCEQVDVDADKIAVVVGVLKRRKDGIRRDGVRILGEATVAGRTSSARRRTRATAGGEAEGSGGTAGGTDELTTGKTRHIKSPIHSDYST